MIYIYIYDIYDIYIYDIYDIYHIYHIYDMYIQYIYVSPSIDVSKIHKYDGTTERSGTLRPCCCPQVAYLNLSQVAALQAWHLPRNIRNDSRETTWIRETCEKWMFRKIGGIVVLYPQIIHFLVGCFHYKPSIINHPSKIVETTGGGFKY